MFNVQFIEWEWSFFLPLHMAPAIEVALQILSWTLVMVHWDIVDS